MPYYANAEKLAHRTTVLENGCHHYTNKKFNFYESATKRFRSPRHIAYELANNVDLPHWTYVASTCRDRYCINPAHLYLPAPAPPASQQSYDEKFWLRVWKKTEKQESGCWIWHGAYVSYGHVPVIFYRGKRITLARKLFESVHGPLPKNVLTYRTCTTSMCINPMHMAPRTRTEHINRLREVGPKPYSKRPRHRSTTCR